MTYIEDTLDFCVSQRNTWDSIYQRMPQSQPEGKIAASASMGAYATSVRVILSCLSQGEQTEETASDIIAKLKSEYDSLDSLKATDETAYTATEDDMYFSVLGTAYLSIIDTLEAAMKNRNDK
ncbi:MAG: hypothetical protein H9W81_13575 [Enterococcus sp.]|nr:hypothetical protein [Enterococcus sp.]